MADLLNMEALVAQILPPALHHFFSVNPCGRGGFAIGLLAAIAYLIFRRLKKKRVELRNFLHIILFFTGIGVAVKIGAVVLEIKDPPISDEERIILFCGPLAVIWITWEMLMQRFNDPS